MKLIVIVILIELNIFEKKVACKVHIQFLVIYFYDQTLRNYFYDHILILIVKICIKMSS